MAQKQALSQTMLLEEITQTRPLSVVMAEEISQLQAWAKDRSVPAN